MTNDLGNEERFRERSQDRNALALYSDAYVTGNDLQNVLRIRNDLQNVLGNDLQNVLGSGTISISRQLQLELERSRERCRRPRD